MSNWERKSCYLLREIVKFRTYIDCLIGAREREQEIRRLQQGKNDKDGSDDGVMVEKRKADEPENRIPGS